MELMMVEPGVVVTYESVRAWCEKFGRQYAGRIRRQCGPMGDVWHMDEVYLKINSECKYLWRAVDQEGQAQYSQRAIYLFLPEFRRMWFFWYWAKQAYEPTN